MKQPQKYSVSMKSFNHVLHRFKKNSDLMNHLPVCTSQTRAVDVINLDEKVSKLGITEMNGWFRKNVKIDFKLRLSSPFRNISKETNQFSLC